MERHLAQNIIRNPKRHLNMNELNSSPSFHRKQPRLCQQKAFNQNRSFSPITKSKYSLSYTSLKEFNLSNKDYLELRQALKRIFSYLQLKSKSNNKQRLTSPYLKQQLIDDDLPLYTNEYFIQNGLLNHNDRPEIYDEIFSSKSIFRFQSLIFNQKYLLTALTNDFPVDQPKRSQSSMELTLFKYHNDNETESMVIRRRKVQTWERENILQQKMSIVHSSIEENDQIEASEYHRSSFVRTQSINNDEKILIEEKGNDKLQNIDNLFPLVKKLGRK
jgi:hypothetical protein